MKIAVAGKGGSGKTTFSALLAHHFASGGREVAAIDADPAGSLAHALGLPPDLAERAVPIAEMGDLIEERTGAKPGAAPGLFRLNPRVDDIPARFSILHRGIRFLRLGTIRGGGAGCMCPESALLRALVAHLVLYERQILILDMEAGLEHLGRATARAVTAIVAVVEPDRRSIATARQIERLAGEIGIVRVVLAANKVRSDAEIEFIRTNTGELPLIAILPYDVAVPQADRDGVAVFDAAPALAGRVREAAARLEEVAR